MSNQDKSSTEDPSLTESEVDVVEERLRLRARVVYQIVKEEGEEELARPIMSLWWSGLAAGLGISMSVVAEGLLHRHLPNAPWRPLVENFGYCAGFLIVVLGRLQLFTENTITAVLPLMSDRTTRNLYLTAQLWFVVLLANVVGTLIFALAITYGGLFAADDLEAFREISRHFMLKSAAEMALHGIPAGFLIAAMVWMIPSAENASFWVITLVTYLIALGDLSHIVAGSTEAFLLLVNGEIGIGATFGTFFFPTLAGNIVGGTVLFAMLAYGQVKEEL